MKILQVTIRTNKFEEELAFYKEIVGLKIVRDLREKSRGIVFLADSEVSPIESPAPYVRFFFVKDPAGVTVQFM